MEAAGLIILQLIGCEGVVARCEEQINQLSGEVWQAWVGLNYRAGQQPVMHGAAIHLLHVGKKQ